MSRYNIAIPLYYSVNDTFGFRKSNKSHGIDKLFYCLQNYDIKKKEITIH